MSAPSAVPNRRRTLRATLIVAAAAATALTCSPVIAQAAPLVPVTELACFGAPARNPAARCIDPSLRRMVYPSPQQAPLQPNAECLPTSPEGLLHPCSFGARTPATNDTIALIGDSHASHWRAAVDVVARGYGRRALSITRSGCAFTKAQAVIPADQVAPCRDWNDELLAWLGRHPEVSTVFLSTRANARYVRRNRATSSFETAVKGHLALWRALPASVKNIFIIRDTPYSSYAAGECVERAYADGQADAATCTRVRAQALHRAPDATAARRLRSPRVHVLDMTRYFCSTARCYQVVGGALVYKDAEHITATFARTLGPFMLGRVAALLRPQPA
ncbi:MAG: hypothetical protein QOE31_3437 [Solirubrobacteraceae bacterium]|nr:hypothetical protein [Solirubrobacteraceae bacterium]